jgi:hypothetical protein
MVDAANWIPMRWPCGPLELAAARRRDRFTPAEAEALDEWCRPAALERLAGTPVSCLVLRWASGAAGDLEQQRALAPLVAEATRRGLRLVGWVTGGELRKAAASAVAAGLSAIATESDEQLPGAPLLRFHGRSLAARGATEFLGASGLVWPGIRATQPRGADASTGPTGPPWLDSNAWYVRLARALRDPGALWLDFDPPAGDQLLAEAAYQLAIADSSVYGARWLLSLDARLRLALSRGSGDAIATWRGIGRALSFFEAQRDWARYRPEGQLGVVSDYSGPDEFLSFEVLNLLARQGSLYRVVDKRKALSTSFDDLDALLYVDSTPPAPELARRLDAFVEAGGTLVAPPFWPTHGTPDDGTWFPSFRVFRSGRGRLAVSRADFADPYLLADDAQLLMSHRHDRLRLFNPGTAQFHYLRSQDGRAGVLHALRYDSPDPRQPLSAWFDEPWSSARAWSLAGKDAAPITRTQAERGAEFTLAPLPGYSALELLA